VLPSHRLPAQHGLVATPHDWHMPIWQTSFASVQLPSAQHACPCAPQLAHIPASHSIPLPHMPPSQHGCMAPPHGTHCVPSHTLPAPHDPAHVVPSEIASWTPMSPPSTESMSLASFRGRS
jgi:hypothetical protein